MPTYSLVSEYSVGHIQCLLKFGCTFFSKFIRAKAEMPLIVHLEKTFRSKLQDDDVKLSKSHSFSMYTIALEMSFLNLCAQLQKNISDI